MTVTIQARSLPYRVTLSHQGICDRCGVEYKRNSKTRDQHITRCRDCRGIK